MVVYDLNLGKESDQPREIILHHLKGELRGLFTIKFNMVDSWFEEEEEIFVHPKDPYKVNLFIFSDNNFS